LKGFGVSLTAGLIISLFTSLFMTRLMFDYWNHRHWLKKLRMLRLFSRPSINFMRIRKIMFTATAISSVLGLGLFLFRGEQGLNVDFIGGTAYGGHLNEANDTVKKLGDGLDITELRQLMNENRQKKLLAVASVEAKEDPSGKFKNLYVIRYADGTEEQVSLSNPPEGKTPEEQIANVKARATTLADWSVEQYFLRGASSGDRSWYFTVRSTEKEPELVQIAIDRLFRAVKVDSNDPEEVVGTNDGKSLLSKTTVTMKKVENGVGWTLTFTDPVGNPAWTSPSFVKTLFERVFRSELGDKLGYQEPFTLNGDNPDKEGRSTKMTLIPADIPELKDQKYVEKILSTAKDRFEARPQPERLETFDATLAAEMRSRALYAILASWLAILLYLWFRFGSWTFGAAAVICLIHDLCFTLG
jgi:SecD/SecF fusion protein